MKKNFKRLSAFFMAMCMTVGIAAGAANEEYASAEIAQIELTTDAVEQKNGSYLVTYQAELTMPHELALAVKDFGQARPDVLRELQFTCTLEDKLVKQFTNPTVNDFTFNKDSIYQFESITNNGSGLEIVYTIDDAEIDSWATQTAEEVYSILRAPMTMESDRMTVTAKQFTAALGGDDTVTTNGTVSISRPGKQVPFYNAEEVVVARGTTTMDIDEYKNTSSGPSNSGNLGGINTYAITVKNPESKGKVTSSHSRAAAGITVTITSSADDGYRLTALDVVASDGSAVKVTKTDDNTYTFTMPSKSVTVTPTFDGAITPPDETGVSSILNTDDHIAYMVGNNFGNFCPNASITRAEVCQVFYNLMKDKSVDEVADFSDVDQNMWYAAAVNKLAAMNIVTGVGDGRFAPNRAITRAEFATIVARFVKENPNGFSFNDVPETHWAYAYITTAVAYGWIGGVGNNRFAPDRNISRTEAATLVNHMLGRIPDKAAIDAGMARVWPDVDNSHWGYYEIAEATTGHDYAFNSDRTVETWIE